MKKKIAATAGMLAFAMALPVFAQGIDASASASIGSTTVQGSVEARITLAKNRADQEIDRRIAMLNALSERVQAMARVSDIVKTNTSNTVTTEVGALLSLKAKVDADNDITTLRSDIRSIATSYRVFMLVIPQGRILVAADKLQTTADAMSTFAETLQTRISEAQTSGNDVTSLSTQLSDMTAKMADAQSLASAAVSLVADLQPDNGDTTIEQSNTAAIQDARTKLRAALADLKAARQDAGSIVQGIKGFEVHASGSASTSMQTQ